MEYVQQRLRSASQSASNFFKGNKKDWEKNLSNLGKYLEKYKDEYNKRKRNGVAIFEIWKAVTHCALLHAKVIELKPEGNVSAYEAARKVEFKHFLEAVTKSVIEAIKFIKEFNTDHHDDANVAVTSAKISELLKDRDAGEIIASDLNRALKDWQENLCKEIYGNQFEDRQAEFNKEIEDQLLEERQKMLADKVSEVTSSPTTNDTSVLVALRDALIENAPSLKIEYLILVAEDIDEVRHIPNIKKLTDVAKQVLKEPRREISKAELMERINEPSNDTFDFFGPLGITMLEDFNMFDFTGCFDTRQYSFTHPDNGMSKRGNLSRFSQLTVSGTTKRNLRIEESAVQYCYVYPTNTKPLTCRNKDDSLKYGETFNLVLNFGGYAYFDLNRKLVQLNAVHNMGDNVYFGRKMRFVNPSDVVAALQAERRLHPVTMAELVVNGVDRYAWLVPGEYGNANHGAFLFTFHDRDTPPCYFELVPFKVGNSNESINAQKENKKLGFFLLNDTLDM